MDNITDEPVINATVNETTSTTIENNQFIDISCTAMVEYLEVVKSEYENERNKKQSFENRAGLIMALLGAICIFLFEQVKLSGIFQLMVAPINFLVLLKITSGLLVYISFGFTMVMIIKTIIVQKHDNFEVKGINEALLVEHRIGALCRIIFTYRDIISQHRERNELRAKAFRDSLYGVSVTLISIIVYVSILL